MIETAPVYWYDEIDSTSEEAKRRARKGDLSPVWIAAKAQSAGRGRLGRNWVSPPGNLFTTVLFSEPGGASMAARMPFAAGLGVVDACKMFAPGAELQLKWPNDVRVKRAKLSGILTESGEHNGVTWVAIGIGINIRYAPEGVGQATTCLMDLGAPTQLDPHHVLTELRPALAKRVKQARNDFSALLQVWQSHAEGLGERIGTAQGEGVFEGLAEDGGLMLRLPDGTHQTIRAGEIELVKQVS